MNMIVIFSIIVLYIGIFGLAISDYVLSSFSLFRIAKKRRIPKPWIAWIPLAQDWTVGSIADDFDLGRNIKRKWRVTLITLCIIVFATAVMMYLTMIIYMILIGTMMSMMEIYDFENYTYVLLAIFYIFIIILSLVSVLYSILKYICLYKIFETIRPEKSVKYTILSLLVPLALSICLLKCSNMCADKSNSGDYI